MKLRDYQESAIASTYQFFSDYPSGSPIIAMPTGTGKSPVIGGFCQSALQLYPQTRILKITHSKELIAQNFDKLMKVWPTAPAGIYSAGLKLKQIGFPITFAGIASLAKSNLELFGRIDLILIDECDLISPKEETMYRRVIAYFRVLNPYLKVIGLTATPWRLGQGRLTDGETPLFTGTAFDACTPDAFAWFFEQGYLLKPIPKPTKTDVDLTKVRIKGGEYQQDDLQAAFDKESITRAAVLEMLEQASNRQCWLIFASGVEHCIHVAEMLNSYDISATFVHSDTKTLPEKERDQRILDFKSGKYQAMVNNGILTTGFDHPPIDFISILRATKSSRLWVQILGRGTRPYYAEGYDLQTLAGRLDAIAASPKQNCLVLDFGKNRQRLGPINDPVIPLPKGKKQPGDAPTKICEVCSAYVFAGARFCEFCGYEFPRYFSLESEAETQSFVKEKEEELLVVEVFKVDRVTYAKYRKQLKPPSIKISYYCGLRMFQEYLCLEHGGYAAKKSRDWWRERCPSEDPPPEFTSDALQRLDLLKEPTHIRVWIKKKGDEILDYDFSGTSFRGTDNA